MNKKTIHVAIGIVFNQAEEILLAWRPLHKEQGGFWEFPGGKLEAGENSYQALCRELFEEIDIEVVSAAALPIVIHEYDRYQVKIFPWKIEKYLRKPIGKEGQNLLWKKLNDLKALDLMPANKKIVDDLSCIPHING